MKITKRDIVMRVFSTLFILGVYWATSFPGIDSLRHFMVVPFMAALMTIHEHFHKT